MKTKLFTIFAALAIILILGNACAEGREEKKFDAEGLLASTSYYDENGALEQRIKFDKNGHKTAEAYYSSDGNLRESMDGWAAMRWQYEDGNLITESYYDDAGKISERKIYNKSGALVDKQFIGDSRLDPNEEFSQPVPALGHESMEYYDSNGKPEGSTTIIKDPWPFWWDDPDFD